MDLVSHLSFPARFTTGMVYGTDATGSEESPQELHVRTLESDTSSNFEAHAILSLPPPLEEWFAIQFRAPSR